MTERTWICQDCMSQLSPEIAVPGTKRYWKEGPGGVPQHFCGGEGVSPLCPRCETPMGWGSGYLVSYSGQTVCTECGYKGRFKDHCID